MASTASVTVEVKTKADLAALKEFKTELEQSVAQGKLTTEQLGKLAAAGVDPFKKGALQGYIDDLGSVGNEAKKINSQFEFFKINQSKAVGEAQVLVRELATGSFHARTLGSLLSALGPGITAAAIAAIVLFEIIKNMVDSARKLKEELATGSEHLARTAENWQRMSEAVRSGQDLATLTRTFANEIENLDDKIAALVRQSADVTSFRRGLQGMFTELGPAAGLPSKGIPSIDIFTMLGIDKGKTLPNIDIFALLGIDKAFAAALKPESDKVLEIQRQLQAEQTNIIAKNIETAKSEQDKAVAVGASKTILVEYTDATGKQIEKQSNLFEEMGRLIDKQNAANTATRDGQKAYAEATQGLAAHVQLMDQVAAINKTLDDNTKKLNAEVAEQVKKGNEHFEQVQKQIQADEDLGKGAIATVENQHKIADEIVDITVKQSTLNRDIPEQNRLWLQLDDRLKNLNTSYNLVSGSINTITENMRKLNAEVEKQVAKGLTGLEAAADLTRKINAEAAVRNAEGNKELVISEQVNLKKLETRQHYEAINKQAGTEVVTEAEIARESEIAGESLRHQLEVREGTGTAQSGLNALLREQETILQGIRQQQEVTEGQAFIGVDEKNLRLLQLYRQQIAQVINDMQRLQRFKGGLTDPVEIEKANREMQKLQFNYQRLAINITTMTHQFQAGLQRWADSFGSVGTQLASTLQQTVGVALQSFNQWIVTGKFNLQSLIQQIEMLGLQLVEQLIIQRVVSMINARLAEAQAVASSKIIAAAWASAATAVTIATEGEAAYAAPGAVAIALAGVQAALGLGMQKGGPVSGSGTEDTVPAMLAPGEFVINRESAQRIGYSNLDELNAMAAGGIVTPGRHFYQKVEIMREPGWQDFYDRVRVMGGFGPGQGVRVLGGFAPGAGVSVIGQPAGWGLPGGGGYQPWTQNPPGSGSTSGGGGVGGGGGGFDYGSYGGYSPGQGTGSMWPGGSGGGFGSMGIGGGSFFVHRVYRGGGLVQGFQSGGTVGGSRSSGSGGRGGGIHIYAFTDLKALTRHMASRDGQKVIFDTVKGRRIDLGMH